MSWRAEDGAMLIIALFVATTLTMIIGALAGLALSSQKASNVYTDNAKLVSALDSGVQAAIENARLLDPAPGCAAAPLQLTAINGYDITISCTASAGPPAVLTFQAQPLCGPPHPPDPPPLGVTATATFSRIGDQADPRAPRVARVASWKIVPVAACPPATPATP